MSQSKTSRWLDLLAFLLQHRYPVTREQIFGSVAGYAGAGSDETARESARRKFERDKDELREAGIELQTVQIPGAEGAEPATGYRMPAKDFYLPYLELVESKGAPVGGAEDRKDAHPYPLRRIKVTRDDLRKLDEATQRVANHQDSPFAAAAASARRKLGFDLPLSVGRIDVVLGRPLGPEGQVALELLQRAVATRTAVRCRYFSIGRDASEQRDVEPYGLFFAWSRWYCVGRARDRDALRVFRVDRMSQVAPLTGKESRFEVPQGFSIRSYLGRAPWDLSDQPATAVRVRFAFPESRWVLSRGTGTAIEPVLADGGAVIEFAVRDRGPFLRWLLTFGRRAEVVEPDAVAAELAALRRRVAQLYAGERA